ncbi:MAG TPA: PLDc N-terminal domain-containing protein [Candidatus Binatia bacterium]|nr:PLDc N-terminal domain-containing protein [Candidatus Binatia bacterium]
MTTLIVLSVVSQVIALWCMMSLWRSRVSLLQKIIWTLVLLVPVLGPIFYGGFFELPPANPEGLRTHHQ